MRSLLKSRNTAIFAALLITSFSLVAVGKTQSPDSRVVRFAELEIDPEHLAEYKAALQEQITSAIKNEPGVLALYAVAVKGRPEQVRVFEIYASQSAYESHLNTAHFKKYKQATKDWVTSLNLTETEPLILKSK